MQTFKERKDFFLHVLPVTKIIGFVCKKYKFKGIFYHGNFGKIINTAFENKHQIRIIKSLDEKSILFLTSAHFYMF